ncbi:TPA: hypothetical protein ACRNPQ_006509, partial [Pseudomonas aeruginosa]
MIEEATSSKHSDTTDAPLVSVVAPCFNAEKYLEEALRCGFHADSDTHS